MLTIPIIASQIRSKDWFVMIDLKDAYFHPSPTQKVSKVPFMGEKHINTELAWHCHQETAKFCDYGKCIKMEINLDLNLLATLCVCVCVNKLYVPIQSVQ